MSTAILYRMGAGYPGDVNRTHPASISPESINTTTPPTAYGQVVVVDATNHDMRPLAAGDASDVTPLAAYGMTVRPFPTQQAQTNQNFGAVAIGAATPPTAGIIDVLRSGFIIGKVPAGQTTVKGGAVYVWCAADSGLHVQGGLENAASAGNTVEISNAIFNGAADADGNVEVQFNV